MKRSLWPQKISRDVWYYECERGSLEFVVYGEANARGVRNPTVFKVRASKLLKSLRRMGVCK